MVVVVTRDRHYMRLWKIRLACLSVVTLLAAGLWANMPYITEEHRRLEPWKLVGLWTGDAMALLWFLRFASIHAIAGEPLVGTRAADRREHLRLVFWSMGAALLIDLAMSLYIMHDEHAAYRRSHVTAAEVTAIRIHKRPQATGYELYCTFRDDLGTPQQAHTRVLANNRVLPPTLQTDAVAALKAERPAGMPIHIRYDPKLPQRAWLLGVGWMDDNGIYWFSIGVVALQAALTLVFVLLSVRVAGRGPGVLPWWLETYKALPVVVEGFLMFAMGAVDRSMDWVTR